MVLRALPQRHDAARQVQAVVRGYNRNKRVEGVNNMNLSKAIKIAAIAHDGQTDKGGSPYILHPLRVMLNLGEDESEAIQICAVLHDVIEDTSITLDDLKQEGFSEEVLTALECLTKRENENYDDFISRVLTNKTACMVKMGDLADNMKLTRIPNPTDKDRKRIEKYRKAYKRIAVELRPNLTDHLS
jgi:(p)ppGpp synthase/HD superfamily hydrolase